MPRAIKVLSAHESGGNRIDTLVLSAEQRRLQHGFVFGEKGTCVEFDFAELPQLRTDDVLLLDDGNVVEIVAQAEPLTEVRAELATLARLAWMLGDRHVPVQILPNRIRLRRDQALEPLLSAAGGKVTAIEAPFEPEGGAYAPSAHDHDHGHGHDHHAHVHDHHADGHDHAHAHEHKAR
jgi:urease accessory protein